MLAPPLALRVLELLVNGTEPDCGLPMLNDIAEVLLSKWVSKLILLYRRGGPSEEGEANLALR